jgi:hypothetical protein
MRVCRVCLINSVPFHPSSYVNAIHTILLLTSWILFYISNVLTPSEPHTVSTDEAVVSAETPCPNVPSGVPSNSCFDYNGLTHICCINPDSCGPLDASGGPTCANGQYVLFNAPNPPPTFTLIGADPLCPVCQGAPSNACFR